MAARSHYNSIFADVRRKHPKASRSEMSGLLKSAYAGKRNPDVGESRPTASNPLGGGLLKWGLLAGGAWFLYQQMNKPATG